LWGWEGGGGGALVVSEMGRRRRKGCLGLWRGLREGVVNGGVLICSFGCTLSLDLIDRAVYVVQEA